MGEIRRVHPRVCPPTYSVCNTHRHVAAIAELRDEESILAGSRAVFSVRSPLDRDWAGFEVKHVIFRLEAFVFGCEGCCNPV